MTTLASRRLRFVAVVLFAGLFVAGGMNHFLSAPFYVSIVPAYLPAPRMLVYVSGVCEVALGVLLVLPRFRRAAAWGLVALLIAVFPANVQMALHPVLYPGWRPLWLWARLPLQGLLVAWALGYTRDVRGNSGERPRDDPSRRRELRR
jgi:uncharacterized membrane protein